MFYATKTKGKPDYIEAKDVLAKDLQSSFYCPYLTCGCRMGFKSFNSNQRKDHFFKLPSSNHSSDCYFATYYKTKSDSHNIDFKTDNFSPENLLNNLFTDNKNSHTNGNVNENESSSNHLKPKKQLTQQIKTLRQLYNFCVLNAPDKKIKDYLRVVSMFAGYSTSYVYTTYISGIKLVECKFNNEYNETDRSLHFTYPIQKSDNMLDITTYFKDQNLFDEMKKKLWDFDGVVIIYAEWDNQVCTIQSKKQIVVLK